MCQSIQGRAPISVRAPVAESDENVCALPPRSIQQFNVTKLAQKLLRPSALWATLVLVAMQFEQSSVVACLKCFELCDSVGEVAKIRHVGTNAILSTADASRNLEVAQAVATYHKLGGR